MVRTIKLHSLEMSAIYSWSFRFTRSRLSQCHIASGISRSTIRSHQSPVLCHHRKQLSLWSFASIVKDKAFALISKKQPIENVSREIECLMLAGDVSRDAAKFITKEAKESLNGVESVNQEQFIHAARKIALSLLKSPNSFPVQSVEQASRAAPVLFLMFGPNGAGKTTSSAKLAHMYKMRGFSVALIAADTFRAAAGKQISALAARSDVPVFKTESAGVGKRNALSVAKSGVTEAFASNHAVVIVDFAGRMHSSSIGMLEVTKAITTLKNSFSSATVIPLLVLDATMGSGTTEVGSAYLQSGVKHILLTKADSCSRAGFILSLAHMGMSVMFVGDGESKENLQLFDGEQFLSALFKDDHSNA